MTTSTRTSSLVLVCAAALLGALGATTIPRALAQDPQPAAEVGRYQISTIPGAVYLVDTRTAEVWVRDYTTKTWRPAGNPVGK